MTAEQVRARAHAEQRALERDAPMASAEHAACWANLARAMRLHGAAVVADLPRGEVDDALAYIDGSLGMPRRWPTHGIAPALAAARQLSAPRA